MRIFTFLLVCCFLIASIASAEQYMCGGDFNGSGFADDPGEVAACAQAGYECPAIPGQVFTDPAECEGACGYQCKPAWRCPFDDALPCVDIDDPANVILKETDMRYLRDDGGGTVYVLNGRPGRCRKSGYRTDYKDCCERPYDKAEEAGKCEFLTGSFMGDDETTARRNLGECHYLGDYCAEQWRGIGCVQRAESYCCFLSLGLGRVLHEEGRPTLKSFGPDGSWGSALSPNCRGFTSDEYQFLETKEVDVSEFIDRYLTLEESWIDTDAIKTWSEVRQELEDAVRRGGE
ncbi:MAG: conjugal transfer protein TraN [Candidatus Nitrospinota bacterium M3_3B_026]